MITVEKLKDCSPEIAEQLSVLATDLSQKSRVITVEELQLMVDDHNTLITIVRDDGRIIGMGTIYVMQQVGQIIGHVDQVVVSGDYRGQGLGEQLMKKIIEEAKGRGLASLSLTSRPARVAANKLYQKLGFQIRETNAYKLSL